MRKLPKQDELTTLMHEEFIGHEISHEDFMVMAVYGAMKRGISKEQALAKYGITEEFYDENVDRVIYG